MQSDKDFPHRAGQIVIHREAFAAPVQRGTHTAQLLRYRAAGFLLPLPYPLNEGLAAKVMARFALFLQLLLKNRLHCDRGVIRATLSRLGHPIMKTRRFERWLQMDDPKDRAMAISFLGRIYTILILVIGAGALMITFGIPATALAALAGSDEKTNSEA